jgi:hypothetical protein
MAPPGARRSAYVRVLAGTILGGVLGFYVMHRASRPPYKAPPCPLLSCAVPAGETLLTLRLTPWLPLAGEDGEEAAEVRGAVAQMLAKANEAQRDDMAQLLPDSRYPLLLRVLPSIWGVSYWLPSKSFTVLLACQLATLITDFWQSPTADFFPFYVTSWFPSLIGIRDTETSAAALSSALPILVESGLERWPAPACADREETKREDQVSEELHLSLSSANNLSFSTSTSHI